jgi:TolA-binding protein
MRRAAPFLIALFLGLAALPAAAQVETREGIALQNQILQLRQEIEMLRRQGGGGAAPAPRPAGAALPGDLTAQLLERIGRLEEEVRALRGRAETAEFQLRQARESIEKLEGDMEFRFQQLPGGGGTARPPTTPPRTGQATPPAPPPAPPPAQPPAARTPAQALAQGQQALGRRDFAAAEAAAREVIAANDRPRLIDANILLGQALAGRNRHQDAAIAFGDAYRGNQRGPRAPEALIGFASALTSLGSRQDACNALNELASTFPNLPVPRAREAEAVRARARC